MSISVGGATAPGGVLPLNPQPNGTATPGPLTPGVAASTTGLPATRSVAGANGLPVMQPSMAATGATQPGAPSSTGATGSTTSQDLSGTDTFLKLLVAQLRNQDPTSPMDSQSFITELAQFNTVEQMINLKQSVNAQASAQQAGEGMALLGKTITYTIQSLGGGNTTTSQGVVTGVMLQGGQVQLQVGTQNVPLNQVTAVAGS